MIKITKKKTTQGFLMILALFVIQSCVGDDYINDRVDPVLRIENKLQSIAKDTTIQLDFFFANNIGIEEFVEPIWESSDETISTVSSSGLLSAIAKGKTVISLDYTYEGEFLRDTFHLTVDEITIEEPEIFIRTGTAKTTTFYDLEGDFELREEGGQLILEFGDDYDADTGLPGLYVYLSNNPNSINGAFEIGAVSVFSGKHAYEIQGVNLFDYSHVLYFCKPFNVKVGDGKLSE